MKREVATLLNERDAGRADAAALRSAVVRTGVANVVQQFASLATRDALQGELDATRARVEALEALIRGTGEAQRTAMANLPLAELTALTPHLCRAIAAVASVVEARVAADAVREAATESAKRAAATAAQHAAAADAAKEAAQAAACVICMNSPKTTVLLACGHKCVCGDCADRLMDKPAEAVPGIH